MLHLSQYFFKLQHLFYFLQVCNEPTINMQLQLIHVFLFKQFNYNLQSVSWIGKHPSQKTL